MSDQLKWNTMAREDGSLLMVEENKLWQFDFPASHDLSTDCPAIKAFAVAISNELEDTSKALLKMREMAKNFKGIQ